MAHVFRVPFAPVLTVPAHKPDDRVHTHQPEQTQDEAVCEHHHQHQVSLREMNTVDFTDFFTHFNVNFTQMSSEFSHEFGLIYRVDFRILSVHIHALFSLHLD